MILDCTIRDGGYYTLWDFNKDLVDDYFRSVNKLPIDYVEIGYLSPPKSGYYGKYFYLNFKEIQNIKQDLNKKVAVLINEIDFSLAELNNFTKEIESVDLIRIAVKPERFEHAVSLAENIKTFSATEIAFNIMYMSTWCKDASFLQRIISIDGLCKYIYLVDSYGGVMPDSIAQVFQYLGGSLEKTLLGFHGHDNISLAFANSIQAKQSGAAIIDCTIQGMGRGAGNLKTELWVPFSSQEVDLYEIAKISQRFTDLQAVFKWGSNFAYSTSGFSSLPQADVMKMLSSHNFRIDHVVKILGEKYSLSENHLINTREHYKKLVSKTLLLIGGGDSVKRFSDLLPVYIEKYNTPVRKVGVRNIEFMHNVKFELVLLGGEYISDTALEVIKKNCVRIIAPYNWAKLVDSRLYESNIRIETHKSSESINTILDFVRILNLDDEIENIDLLGFDGYSHDMSKNNLKQINENIFGAIKTLSKVVSLSRTEYLNVEQDSIYSRLL